MPGILESMFAGAAVGGGAAMEDVYRRRDQSEIESKLAEQKARADQDRQIALQNLRQQGAVELQKDQQGYTSGENAIRRTYESGEKALDRTQQSEEKKLDRDLTGRHYGIIESQNEASNARYDRQMTESERHNRSMEGIYSGRDAAKADGKSPKMPDHVVMQLKDMESEQKSIDQEIRRIRGEAATKPEIAMNPEMKGGIEAQVKNLQSQRASIEMRKTRTYIDNGAIDPENVVSSQAAKFDSIDDVNKFIQDHQKIGGQAWANQIADALENAGVPQRVSNMKAKDGKQEPAISAPKKEGGPSNNAPMGVIESGVSLPSMPTGGVRVGRAGQATVGASYPAMSPQAAKGLSAQEIMKLDATSIRGLLANRDLLTPEQIQAAADRYRQVR